MGHGERMCSRQHAHTMWVSSSFFLLSILFSCSGAVLRHQQGLRAPPSSSGAPPPDPLWFQQMLDHFRPSETHRVGWAMIRKKFKLCSNFGGKNTNYVTNLFESLVGNFEGIVQYNRDDRDFEGAQWTNVTIDTVCQIMLDQSKGSAIDRLAAVNDLSLEMSGEKCLDHSYDNQVLELQQTAWESNAAAGGRQWIYQTCTEFGWY